MYVGIALVMTFAVFIYDFWHFFVGMLFFLLDISLQTQNQIFFAIRFISKISSKLILESFWNPHTPPQSCHHRHQNTHQPILSHAFIYMPYNKLLVGQLVNRICFLFRRNPHRKKHGPNFKSRTNPCRIGRSYWLACAVKTKCSKNDIMADSDRSGPAGPMCWRTMSERRTAVKLTRCQSRLTRSRPALFEQNVSIGI